MVRLIEMKSRKAQIIPEFIIVTAVVLGLMLFVFVIAAEKETESIGSKRFLEAKTVADDLSLAINQVHLGGPETRRVLWVPTNLPSGIGFSLYVIPNARVARIEWNSTKGLQFYDSSLLTSNIKTSMLDNSSKFPRINNSQLKIYNSGGGVYLEPV